MTQAEFSLPGMSATRPRVGPMSTSANEQQGVGCLYPVVRHYVYFLKTTRTDRSIPGHLFTEKQALPSDMQMEILRIVREDVPRNDVSEDLVSQQALPPISVDKRAY